MKPHLPGLLFLLNLSAIGLAAKSQVSPADRPRLTEELRMKVENTSPPPSAIIAGSDNGSLVLEPYKVKSTYVAPLLKSQDVPEPDSRAFGAGEGGYFLRRQGPSFMREVKFQFSPRNNAFEFLRFSW